MLEGMLKDICGADLFTSIYETLSTNLFSPSGTYSATYKIVKDIHDDVITPVAIMLLFLYFMIALVDKLSSENFTWEQLWRSMAQLLAAKLLIDYGFDILEILFQIGMSIAASVDALVEGGGSLTPEEFDPAAMIKEFEKANGWNRGFMKIVSPILMFIYLIIPWVFSWVLSMAVRIICYTRVVELYLRAAFAPIALSDFFHSGLQGGGWRFLKNFLAVSLQGVLILVIAVIFSTLFKGLFTTMTANIILDLVPFVGVYLSFLCAAVMLMFKSLSLAKELVGTN